MPPRAGRPTLRGRARKEALRPCRHRVAAKERKTHTHLTVGSRWFLGWFDRSSPWPKQLSAPLALPQRQRRRRWRCGRRGGTLHDDLPKPQRPAVSCLLHTERHRSGPVRPMRVGLHKRQGLSRGRSAPSAVSRSHAKGTLNGKSSLLSFPFHSVPQRKRPRSYWNTPTSDSRFASRAVPLLV